MNDPSVIFFSDVKKLVRKLMIKPITNPTLQESKEDENVPRGILLFGQPGTGKFINDVMLWGGRAAILNVPFSDGD